MKKQLVVIGIMLVLLAVGLSGCSEQSSEKSMTGALVNLEKSDKEKIVGTWGCEGGTITFTVGGELYWIEGKKGSYRLENGNVNSSFIIDDRTCNQIFKYTFENDNTLILEYERGAQVFKRLE